MAHCLGDPLKWLFSFGFPFETTKPGQPQKRHPPDTEVLELSKGG